MTNDKRTYDRIYRQRNKEHIRASQRDYYRKNKERLSELSKSWYENNKARVRFLSQRWYRLNRERLIRYGVEWARRNPLRKRASARRFYMTAKGKYGALKSGAARRGVPLEISRKDFIDWFEKQEKKCVYCGRELLLDLTRTLVVERRNNNVGYAAGNIVLACFRCNLIKGKDISYECMVEIGKVLKKFRDLEE